MAVNCTPKSASSAPSSWQSRSRVRHSTVEGANADKRTPELINGKVWVPDPVFGGYQRLPENDPKYKEILGWIDSQRFVELLDWVYNRG
jgi:hypothetical protein